jgi:LmbE family N-acetylglucosaminyl deacetylase
MNVALIVAAHPDDEVLGAGGVAARLSRSGHDVHIRILGEGATSRVDDRSFADPSLTDDLCNSAQRAGSVLGASSVSVRGLPDNRFDSLDLLDVVKIVEGEIAELQPTVVFTHSVSDLNIDHALTARAVVTATRPMAQPNVRTVLCFEILSSTEWGFGRFGSFEPDCFYEISKDDLEMKVGALRCYGGEIYDSPHPRSTDGVVNLARLRGSTIGVDFAEAFTTVRTMKRLDDAL